MMSEETRKKILNELITLGINPDSLDLVAAVTRKYLEPVTKFVSEFSVRPVDSSVQ